MESNGTDPNQSESPPGNNPQIVTATGGSDVTGVIQGNTVIGNILVTGDHNQVFTGPYERLRDAYIKPKSVFERVRLERFFGRRWLIAKIEAFLEEYESGYFVLEAKAGLGKTALLAHLVQKLSAIHHFVELAPGADGIAPSLKSLAAQIIIAWELLPQGADEVVPGTATRPEFLQNLLFEAAQKRDETKPDEKIIVVVDALDEAGVPAGQNVLGLPKVLPKGVYFIVSQRPVEIALTTSANRVVFTLEANDQQNLDDMKGFLEEAAKRERVRKELEAGNHTPEDFVQTLLAKCRGVWIYLYYVVNEIERGERFPLVLETLPQGVWQFYAQYWQRWRKQDDWDRVLLPLLGGLAAVQEDVSLKVLCNLTGVNEEGSKIRRLLDETWRPFLVVTEENEKRYRLYHASLREFLDGRADLTELTEQEKTFTRELANATREAHGRISDAYLDTWGGLKNNLARLQDGSDGSLPKEYGLKHLAAHLEKGDRATELHQLLRVERVHEEQVDITRKGWRGLLDRMLRRRPTVTRRTFENIWYGAQESASDVSGYLSDVARAWRVARKSQANPVSLPVRYALITASINSLAQNITPELLHLLVENNKWTVTQAWSYARQTPDEQQKADALLRMLPYRPPSLTDETIREVLTAIRQMTNVEERIRLLAELAPQLSEEAQRQVFKYDWGDWVGTKVSLLEALAPHLHESIKRELLAEIHGKEVWDQAKMLAALLPHLPEPLKTETAQTNFFEMHPKEQYSEGKAYRSSTQAMMVAAVVPYLPEPLKQEAFDFIFADTSSLSYLLNDTGAASTPGKLLSHLSGGMKPVAVAKILLQIEKVEFPRNRVEALISLAPHVTATAFRDSLLKQLAISFAAVKEEERDYLFKEKLPLLAKAGFPEEALKYATGIKRDYLMAEAVKNLAPDLSDKALREALTFVNQLDSPWYKNEALSTLLVRQAELGGIKEALASVHAMERNKWKLETLTGLFPHLDHTDQEIVLQQAVEIARATRDDYGDYERVVASVIATLADLGAHQQALEFARSAEPAWIQVRAFSQLLPKLPEQIRQKVEAETIEKVLTIDPYSRVFFLAELVPVLSPKVAATALVQGLSATASIENQTYKTEGLTALLPHAPKSIRGEIVQKVLVSVGLAVDAEAGIDEYKKAEALRALAPYLSEQELKTSWDLAKILRGDYARDRALTGIAAYLPQPFVRQAIAEIKNEYERGATEAWRALLPRLAETGDATDALTRANAIQSVSNRTYILATLTKYLTPDALQHLTEETKTVRDKSWQARILLAIIPFTPEPEKAHLVELAIQSLQIAYDHEFKAQAFATLLPLVPSGSKAETLKQIIKSSQQIYRQSRRDIYTALVPHIVQLPAPERQSTWNEILQVLASKSRGDLFSDLAVFMPVIGDLGGASELLETYQAIQDTVHWWG